MLNDPMSFEEPGWVGKAEEAKLIPLFVHGDDGYPGAKLGSHPAIAPAFFPPTLSPMLLEPFAANIHMLAPVIASYLFRSGPRWRDSSDEPEACCHMSPLGHSQAWCNCLRQNPIQVGRDLPDSGTRGSNVQVTNSYAGICELRML